MSLATSHRSVVTAGLLAGVGALAGASLFAWLKYRSRPDDAEAPAAAFAGPGAHVDSFVQTRDAGPEHIRDEEGGDWDRVDEASDESFPSSDPPARNDFRTPEPIDYGENKG